VPVAWTTTHQTPVGASAVAGGNSTATIAVPAWPVISSVTSAVVVAESIAV
jgi:hypothetical protein